MHSRLFGPCALRGYGSGAYLLVALIVFCASTLDATAQTEPRDPFRRIFGIGDNEFIKAGWVKMRPGHVGMSKSIIYHADSLRQVWNLCDWLGINIIRYQQDEGADITDSMIRARSDTLRQRLILDMRFGGNSGNAFLEGAWGRELKFYTFTGRDSVQYRSWPCKFLTLRGGTTDTNASSPVEEDDYGEPALEQQYRTSTGDTANTVIAEGIVFNWDSAQTVRYPNVADNENTNVMRTEEFLGGASQHLFSSTTQYVTVTGHLFDLGPSADTTNILKIEVIYEVPPGFPRVIHGNPDYTTSSSLNLSYTLAVLYVRKSDLYPANTVQPNWNAYRSVSLPFDARWVGGTPNFNTGPLYPGNKSQRINMKVTWLGTEDVAIRSIALRDSIGELVLGSGPASIAYRSDIMLGARQGAAINSIGFPYRWPVIARACNLEQQPMHATCFNHVYKLTRDTVTGWDYINNRYDSIPAWTEIGEDPRPLHQLADSNFNANAVVVEMITRVSTWLGEELKHPWQGRIPSIVQHNGGRGGIPVLPLNADSIEHTYESNLQTLGFRQYAPYRLPDHYEKYLSLSLGRGAEIARDQRRRLIVVPFCVSRIAINELEGIPTPDTLELEHFQEPAEMRTMANIALAYGARGLHWQVVHGPYNFLANLATVGNKTFRHGWLVDNGVCGPFTRDTMIDVHDSLTFRGPDSDGLYSDSTNGATFYNFYTGWKIRSRAVREIHQRIDELWPELSKLDWRDGYSMHFAAPQKIPGDPGVVTRPLPSDEIVRSIRTRKPNSTVLDSAHRTYVELGLFDMKNSTTNSLQDTHHIFVVNRRCFERPDDIGDWTEVGQEMNRLAETREIDIEFNLKHPVESNDTTRQYDFIRVQEIVPDRTRLPGNINPRKPLDTVIYASKTARLVLGPGRAALLRITYVPPETSFDAGDLRFNNQRKMVFDGRRYHCVYWRRDTAALPAHNVVYYRRSYQMTDTTGPIYWEPEFAISESIWKGNVPSDVPDTMRVNNVFPSLSLRTVGGDTVINVVWACHPAQTTTGAQREVVFRNLYSPPIGTDPVMPGPLEVVDWHLGVDSTVWGTPVISTSTAGEFIAYSDSVSGVYMKYRTRPAGTYWWLSRGTYSNRQNTTAAGAPASRYPSVPAFSSSANGRDNCALVYEQSFGPGMSRIDYYRYYQPTVPGTLPWPLFLYRLTPISRVGRPSIDAINLPGQVMEQVAWESIVVDNIGNQPIYVATAESMVLSNSFPPGALLPSPGPAPSGRRTTRLNFLTVLPPLGPPQTAPSVAATYGETSQYNGKTRYLAEFSQRYQLYPGIYNAIAHEAIQQTLGYLPAGSITFDSRLYRYIFFESANPNGSSAQTNQRTRAAMIYQTRNVETGNLSLLRTSREFFAKSRPTDYSPEGRQIIYRMQDSMRAIVTGTLHDVWVADDDGSTVLRFVERDSTTEFPDSLSQAQRLFRTENFHAHDSTLIGFEVHARFLGDTTLYDSARFNFHVELVDSATGLTIAHLDSFMVDAPTDHYFNRYQHDFDLLSGTYYLRMRLTTTDFVPAFDSLECRYPVGIVTSIVDSSGFSKVRRAGTGGGAAVRLSAQPNPFDARTELLFSIPRPDYVSVTLFDVNGREIGSPVRRQLMDVGRYAVEIDGTTLMPGTYLVELRHGPNKIIGKIVVSR